MEEGRTLAVAVAAGSRRDMDMDTTFMVYFECSQETTFSMKAQRIMC